MTIFRDALASAPKIHPDAVWQLFKCGPTWDGNLISKTDRDKLVAAGFVDRSDGWNWLTSEGVRFALELGMGHDDRKRASWWSPTKGPQP